MPVCRRRETLTWSHWAHHPRFWRMNYVLRWNNLESQTSWAPLPLIVLSSSSFSNKQNFLHFCSFAIRDGLSFVFAFFCFPSTIFFSKETNFAFPGSRCLKLQNFSSGWRRVRHKYFCGIWGEFRKQEWRHNRNDSAVDMLTAVGGEPLQIQTMDIITKYRKECHFLLLRGEGGPLAN